MEGWKNEGGRKGVSLPFVMGTSQANSLDGIIDLVFFYYHAT